MACFLPWSFGENLKGYTELVGDHAVGWAEIDRTELNVNLPAFLKGVV
jgi:hypothetical protein